MKIPNNPAGRLHSLLERLQQMDRNKAIGLSWARLLELDWPQDFDQQLKRISDIVSLPRQIDKAVKEAWPDEHDLLLRHLPGITEAVNLAIRVDMPLGSQLDLVRPEGMYGLEYCSLKLGRHSAERSIETDEIESLLATVVRLESEVEQATFDPDVQRLVLDLIREIKESLLEVRVNGSAGLERSLDRAVGTLVRRPDLYGRLQSQNQTVFKRLGTVLAQLALLVTVVGGVVEIPVNLKDLLEIGEDPPLVVVVIDPDPNPDPATSGVSGPTGELNPETQVHPSNTGAPAP